jgi:hypothetical protein
MNLKIVSFLGLLISTTSTASKFGNVELRFGAEIIMNEVGGVIADTPDQLENIVKTYLGWKPTYAREFSHVPFNSPEAQSYRAAFLKLHPDLFKEIKNLSLASFEDLIQLQNSLVSRGWPKREAEEFIHIPLSSREARMYRRRFVREHPTLRREGVTNAYIIKDSNRPPISLGIAKRAAQLTRKRQ